MQQEIKKTKSKEMKERITKKKRKERYENTEQKKDRKLKQGQKWSNNKGREKK